MPSKWDGKPVRFEAVNAVVCCTNGNPASGSPANGSPAHGTQFQLSQACVWYLQLLAVYPGLNRPDLLD
jgi:hypothetical protein